MPKLATWLRVKDEKWFQPFFAKHPEIEICNARNGEVAMAGVNGLLLTGGSDIAPEFEISDLTKPPAAYQDRQSPVGNATSFSQALNRALDLRETILA